MRESLKEERRLHCSGVYSFFCYHINTYSSSGVNRTTSSVNSGGKLAKSLSESKRGLKGGGTCFCSSYKKKS